MNFVKNKHYLKCRKEVWNNLQLFDNAHEKCNEKYPCQREKTTTNYFYQYWLFYCSCEQVEYGILIKDQIEINELKRERKNSKMSCLVLSFRR